MPDCDFVHFLEIKMPSEIQSTLNKGLNLPESVIEHLHFKIITTVLYKLVVPVEKFQRCSKGHDIDYVPILYIFILIRLSYFITLVGSDIENDRWLSWKVNKLEERVVSLSVVYSDNTDSNFVFDSIYIRIEHKE